MSSPQAPEKRRARSRRPALACIAASMIAASMTLCAGSPAAAAPLDQQLQRQSTDQRLPDPEPTPEASTKQAEVILAKPEYQPPERNLLQKVLDWIIERLGDLLRPMFGGVGGGASPLMWVVLALLVAVAIFFVSRIRRGRRFTGGPDEGDALEVFIEEARSVDEWQREADRYEADGKWKEGLLCRYRALVGQLVARGALRDLPGRTAGEYRVEMARDAGWVAAPFAGASELFERAWYGNRDTGPAQAERFRELTTEVLLGYDREPEFAGAGASSPNMEAPR